MSFDPAGIGAVFNVGKTLIDKIWVDADKRAEETRKLEELKQSGDLVALNAHVQLMLAQIKVNSIEASHKSVFVAGWRPFVGWVGGISLAYAAFVYPLLSWVWVISGAEGEPPPFVESATLSAVITGMLGVGGMRSYDKKQGNQTDKIRQ